MLTDVKKTIVSKALVLGDQGVGKTSLVLRYIEHEFLGQISPTVGASYFPCSIHVEDILVKLQIWDTAGQERFRSMAPMFYRNANAALLVFDITKPESFSSIKDWVLELNGNIDEPIVLSVIGSKSDLLRRRQIPREEAIKYSTRIGAKYYECSALYNQGVEQVFTNIALELVKQQGESVIGKSMGVCDGLSVATSLEVSTIDFGTVILPASSKESIAHGIKVNNNCCN